MTAAKQPMYGINKNLQRDYPTLRIVSFLFAKLFSNVDREVKDEA